MDDRKQISVGTPEFEQARDNVEKEITALQQQLNERLVFLVKIKNAELSFYRDETSKYRKKNEEDQQTQKVSLKP